MHSGISPNRAIGSDFFLFVFDANARAHTYTTKTVIYETGALSHTHAHTITKRSHAHANNMQIKFRLNGVFTWTNEWINAHKINKSGWMRNWNGRRCACIMCVVASTPNLRAISILRFFYLFNLFIYFCTVFWWCCCYFSVDVYIGLYETIIIQMHTDWRRKLIWFAHIIKRSSFNISHR